MKILYLNADSPVNNGNQMVFGGWTYTLENCIARENDFKIGIAFPTKTDYKFENEEIKYYSINISINHGCLRKLLYKVPFFKIKFNKEQDEFYNNKLLEVINNFQPDLIHIWGSESNYGLISTITSIPCILHIQGVLTPIMDMYYPIGNSKISIIKALIPNLRKIYSFLWSLKIFRINAKRECLILSKVSYVIGRTEWDKNVASIFSPKAQYFYCSEMLRPKFLNSDKWCYKDTKKLIVMSSISVQQYKGFDVVLRTANLLKRIYGDNFEWRVFGINNSSLFERLTKLKAKDVNVICLGKVNVNVIVENLLQCDVFCHLSYIDNSSNAICEAQYLGVPVIASDAGGTASLLKNNSGILVPINDAYQTAAYIKRIKCERAFSERLSHNEIHEATPRHDPNFIRENLIRIYKTIYEHRINQLNVE